MTAPAQRTASALLDAAALRHNLALARRQLGELESSLQLDADMEEGIL